MNKSEQLYCELKGQLVARAPGSTFRTVRSIMDDFDVSQATVSSAIQRLTEKGLLRKTGTGVWRLPTRCSAIARERSRPTVLRFRADHRNITTWSSSALWNR